VVISISSHPNLVAAHSQALLNRERDWSRSRLIFALFLVAGTGFIESLEAMEEEADQSEARLRKSPRDEEILAILGLEKSLIHITTAVKSNHALMEKFTRTDHPFCLTLSDEERELLDDAMTENQQAIFMADIFGQVLSSLSDAFGSIISNSLNKTMKFLAGVTIVLTIPMVVAGFYGMNMALPGAGLPLAFWGICALCAGMMLAVSVLFAKKHWF
jgi:magnesium transporter